MWLLMGIYIIIIRQRHSNGKINLEKEIDLDALLVAHATNVLNADSETETSDAEWQSYHCFLANIQCITNKLIELNCLLASNKYALLCLTETWFDSLWDNNSVIQDQNYSILRSEHQLIIMVAQPLFIITIHFN